MSQGKQGLNGDNVLVALGGNATSSVGDPRATVLAALDRLKTRFAPLAISGLYQTPAFPAGSGPDFVNAACSFQTDLPADDILSELHTIEADFGRTRTLRWGQRTLDLDLIACGDLVLPDAATFAHWQALPLEAQKTDTPDRLILPHPRLQDRPFVLVPLADVAPDWVHPVLGVSVMDMLEQYSTDARAEIRPLQR